jgi:hypothetical protein
MAAATSAMVAGTFPSEGLPNGRENQKTHHADVILIVVSVLNLSCEEYRLKKGEAWLSLG